MTGYVTAKDDVTVRLRRVEGQVRGLQRLVNQDAGCIDVLTQIAAATRALEAVAVTLLEEHLQLCVEQAIRAGDDSARVRVHDAAEAVRRLVRS
ncbi:metal-sensitive transcriptional regulator [Kineosporia sp. R_H_3]|uniref:metal-sensitive transcriptional regulator n=1 Tax=Kineosporia sp. R_H_3 TaxID=1961848 RepID=UPI000B4B57C0|nr:metal-sensitive transcriptional regulator [Kineosporia sp. R_H_3]